MNYSVTQIEKIVNGKFLLNQNSAAVIEHLLLDSRKLLFPESSIFFALSGPRRNGNSFIKELYSKGIRNFVVDENIEVEAIPAHSGSNFLQVKDVQHALHLLVSYHRAQFNIPVIGITGSNGKTMVKEWLYQLLQEDYNIVRSPKSYNSQTGVPLSVWQMNETHTLAIFEAGISQPGEMQQLEKIIQPGIGVFTSIGEAHSEGFLSIRQKVNEKLNLFVHSGLLIFGADNPDLNSGVNTFTNNVRRRDDLKTIFMEQQAVRIPANHFDRKKA